jgi:hypothetical protein
LIGIREQVFNIIEDRMNGNYREDKDLVNLYIE